MSGFAIGKGCERLYEGDVLGAENRLLGKGIAVAMVMLRGRLWWIFIFLTQWVIFRR
jgi:hypothetical protein